MKCKRWVEEEFTSALNVDGVWELNGAYVSAANRGSVTVTGEVTGGSYVSASEGGSVTVAQGGTAAFERFAGNAGSLNVNGGLEITGDSTDETASGADVTDRDFVMASTALNLGAGSQLTLGSGAVQYVLTAGENAGEYTVNTENWKTEQVTAAAGAVMNLHLGSDVTSLTHAQALNVRDSLLGSGTGASVVFADVDITDITANEDGSYDYSDVAGGVSDAGIASSVVNVDAGNAATGVSGVFGSLNLADGVEEVTVKGGLILNAAPGQGAYASSATATAPADFSVKDGAALNLNGSGFAGNITGEGGSVGINTASATTQDTVQVGDVTGVSSFTAGSQVYAGAIDACSVVTQQGASITSASQDGVSAADFDIRGSLSAVSVTVKGAEGGEVSALKVTGTGSSAEAGSLAYEDGGLLHVTGSADFGSATAGTSALNVIVGDASNSGFLSMDSLNLNGGLLSADPEFGHPATPVEIAAGAKVTDTVNAHGTVAALRNSVIAVGASASGAQDAAKRLGYTLANGSLSENGTGAVLYLGAHYEVDEGQGILITPDARHDAANPGVITGTGQGALTFPVNGLEMTEGGALVVSQALAYDSTGTDVKAAVTFKAANATVKTDTGSQIVLDRAQILGNQTVKLFADADGAVDASRSEADIYAANGILKGTMDSSGNVTFAVDADKAASSMTAMSSPVRGLAVKVLTNGGNAYDTADAGVGYISYVNADRGGKAIEETARMAVYGGAVQAARLASGMTADTVDARLNGQAASGIISSETYEGAGIWFTPVYRNLNSDGFDADGASYGADVDLYGAMLGADYSFGNGVKAGGFFGTGTGDGDGAETGSDVSSDFDWWNIGLYAGWTSGAWQVTGDLSYTELSAEMDQSTGSDLYGTLSADTDVTALSLGVTGEYTFSTAWMDITPHAGLRWTQLDMDSYSVKGHGGTIAQSDADAMNVFSLPAGVTFATEVTSGQFTVKPYADLTLAANFGDTELDSDVTFTGAESTGLTSEVIDDFTYGVALGLNVAYGEALTFGIGASWTGSENADSVGVSGNVRYAF